MLSDWFASLLLRFSALIFIIHLVCTNFFVVPFSGFDNKLGIAPSSLLCQKSLRNIDVNYATK